MFTAKGVVALDFPKCLIRSSIISIRICEHSNLAFGIRTQQVIHYFWQKKTLLAGIISCLVISHLLSIFYHFFFCLNITLIRQSNYYENAVKSSSIKLQIRILVALMMYLEIAFLETHIYSIEN